MIVPFAKTFVAVVRVKGSKVVSLRKGAGHTLVTKGLSLTRDEKPNRYMTKPFREQEVIHNPRPDFQEIVYKRRI